MSPIILQMSSDISFGLALQILNLFPIQSTYLLLAMIIAVFILMWLLDDDSLGAVSVFIVGISSLMFLLHVIDDINPGMIQGRVELIPDGWNLFCLLLSVFVASLLGKWSSLSLTAYIDRYYSGKGKLLFIPVSGLFGLIPLFVYGMWLGEQIRSV